MEKLLELRKFVQLWHDSAEELSNKGKDMYRTGQMRAYKDVLVQLDYLRKKYGHNL